MTEHPGRPRPSARTGLVARLSRSALARNHTALREEGLRGALDLRADAWGHGADVVAGILGGADAAPDAPLLDNARLLGLVDGYAPVMTLLGRVLSTKALRTGEGVSYGYTHRAAHDTTVALVTGGYAQGVLRSLGNRVSVRIGGAGRPIVGRVAMDVCVVDTGESGARPGDEVEFFGPGLPIARWAEATGLSAGELVAAVGLRARREVGA